MACPLSLDGRGLGRGCSDVLGAYKQDPLSNSPPRRGREPEQRVAIDVSRNKVMPLVPLPTESGLSANESSADRCDSPIRPGYKLHCTSPASDTGAPFESSLAMSNTDYIISATGVRMPRLIYGTAWKKDKTAACVQRALTFGFRGIDTACQPKHYFEPGVGEGIAAYLSACQETITRADLYIQTKFTSLSGQDPKQVPYDSKAPLAEQVAQSFQISLRNLRTEYLDCLVLHSPMERDEQTKTVWRAMEALVDQGGVRQIGISNCYEPAYFEQLHRWARIKPAVLQNRFYDTTGYDKELRAFCRQQQIVYQSFWTLSANPHVLACGTVKALASKYQRTAAQILFRYLTQEAIVPLTGTQSEVHLREDLSIFEFELADAERVAMTALL